MTPRQERRWRKRRNKLIGRMEAAAAELMALDPRACSAWPELAQRLGLEDTTAAAPAERYDGPRRPIPPQLEALCDAYGMIRAAAVDGEDLRPERDALVAELTSLYEELRA